MAVNLHIVWVTRLGMMFIEREQAFRDREAAARNALEASFNPDIRQFTPVYIETIDGDFIGIIHPDHFIIMTPEEVQEMVKEKNDD